MSLFRPFLILNHLKTVKTAYKLDRSFINNFQKYTTATTTRTTRPKLDKGKVSPAKEADEDSPVKFTSSPASKWHAQTSRIGQTDTRPWFEPYVVLASLSVFMLYFMVLREENDVDIELSKSLYSRIDGLEEQQLRQSLEHNLRNNLDTKAIIERLKEIESEKIQK